MSGTGVPSSGMVPELIRSPCWRALSSSHLVVVGTTRVARGSSTRGVRTTCTASIMPQVPAVPRDNFSATISRKREGASSVRASWAVRLASTKRDMCGAHKARPAELREQKVSEVGQGRVVESWCNCPQIRPVRAWTARQGRRGKPRAGQYLPNSRNTRKHGFLALWKRRTRFESMCPSPLGHPGGSTVGDLGHAIQKVAP